MAPTIQEIITPQPMDPSKVTWVSKGTPSKIEIEEWSPSWGETFETLKTRLVKALGSTALSIEHTGSTSVPNLPAKGIIDIDVIVQDASDENAYVSALEKAGFEFILREPEWNNHRFFKMYEPLANLHVFGPEDPEPIRHRIFRDWLRLHPEDAEKYAAVKRDAAAASSAAGETVLQYSMRKESVIIEIINRAFRSLGYID